MGLSSIQGPVMVLHCPKVLRVHGLDLNIAPAQQCDQRADSPPTSNLRPALTWAELKSSGGQASPRRFHSPVHCPGVWPG